MASPSLFSAPLEFVVPPAEGRLRLDAALGLFLPKLGVRARRRLWHWRRITVNGKERKPGHMLEAGDVIRIEAPHDEERGNFLLTEHAERLSGETLKIVAADDTYIAFLKPAGLHSARIAGSPGASLEEALERDWPEVWHQWMDANATFSGVSKPSGGAEKFAFPVPKLLTRLDLPTSGLVLAARNEEAERRFRIMERQGQVVKTYLALVAGRLEEPLCLQRALDADSRSKTRVLPENDPDEVRHTHATPLRLLSQEEKQGLPPWVDRDQECTLVGVKIRRGARHQIRVHLADAGFALVGDSLYAPEEREMGEAVFFLHHAKLALPDFSACAVLAWPFLDSAPVDF